MNNFYESLVNCQTVEGKHLINWKKWKPVS